MKFLYRTIFSRKYTFTHTHTHTLDGGFTSTVNCTCPPENEGNSKGPKAFALKMSNIGIHFWPRVTLLKLVVLGVICYGDFNSGVEKYLKHC
jgi:hypothetical protein